MGIVGVLFEIAFHLIGAVLELIFGFIWTIIKYIGFPILGIAILCGIVYALFCAIRDKINPLSPPPKETTPPNLRRGTESGKQCKDCFYCGRNMSESGEGLAHLCTKHHTIISKYMVCDDLRSYIDVFLGIK